jgi:hypothetical protein
MAVCSTFSTFGAMLILNNSTVSGNTANYGGGIYNYGSTLTLTNSTISGNKSSYNGGGILIQSETDPDFSSSVPQVAQVDLTFCTIYGNIAHNSGGIAIEDDAFYAKSGNSKPIKQISQLTIRNSIVVSDPAHLAPDISGILTSYGYNLFQNNSGATIHLATSKQESRDKFLSPNDLTKLFADPAKNLALAPDSPAIDQIPLAACHITVTVPIAYNDSGTPTVQQQYTFATDQRGKKRPDDSEDLCDIGAYEASY